MNAVLLTVGDELLIGQVVNTNAAWLGEHLDALGVDVVRTVTVGDEIEAITSELQRSFEAAELVIVTGGLGPTHDDVTKEAVAAFFGTELEFHPDIFERVRERLTRKGRTVPESNRTQAMVPRGFEVLPNPVGSAPGLWYADEAGPKERLIVVLPGVPYEMKHLMLNEALPRLREHKGLRVITHRTLLTAGIGESHLQDLIGDLSGKLGPNLRLAYLPSTSGVRLRITARGNSHAEVDGNIAALENHLRQRIDRYIFGSHVDTLEGVVGRMLAERGLTVSVAESCTGGYVLNRLTNVSGSSSYVVGGIVAYSNNVKIEQLGVSPDVLEEEGAVSETVARQMAAGVRRRLGTNIGISTTGVAGPTGGTPEKPVGMVWVGYADEEGDRAVRLQLAEERILNKELTSTAVLDIIRRRLLGLS